MLVTKVAVSRVDTQGNVIAWILSGLEALPVLRLSAFSAVLLRRGDVEQQPLA